jgi:hypothetical protein
MKELLEQQIKDNLAKIRAYEATGRMPHTVAALKRANALLESQLQSL